MTIDHKNIWILSGYETFALKGPSGIKIEPLAKKISKSKSSFYHFFADLEIFIEELLQYHLTQSRIIAQKELQAKNINPDLIDIIVSHKIDLLFNRQLRINRDNKSYSEVLMKSNEIIGNAFVLLWIKDLNIKLSRIQLEAIFELALENFYLQINSENLNHKWLTAYFNSLRSIVEKFI